MNKVLIVDDDALFLQGFAKALQAAGMEVNAAETGGSALREIAASSYPLCFLDLFLPDADGIEVMRKIREISPDTSVVVMTAGVVTPAMQEKIERDAEMFITKPVDLLQVKMLARRILAGRAG